MYIYPFLSVFLKCVLTKLLFRLLLFLTLQCDRASFPCQDSTLSFFLTALPLTRCVALYRLFNLSESWVCFIYERDNHVIATQGCHED